MKIQSLPKEFLVELLHYLADHAPLEGLEKITGQDFSLEDAQAALREVAAHLASEVREENSKQTPEVPRDRLSIEAQELLSSLSPVEEKRLLKAFGFFNN